MSFRKIAEILITFMKQSAKDAIIAQGKPNLLLSSKSELSRKASPVTPFKINVRVWERESTNGSQILLNAFSSSESGFDRWKWDSV